MYATEHAAAAAALRSLRLTCAWRRRVGGYAGGRGSHLCGVVAVQPRRVRPDVQRQHKRARQDDPRDDTEEKADPHVRQEPLA